MTTGKELRKQGVDILRAAGWVVRFMDHHRRMPQGSVGFPDVIAFRSNHVLMIEIKRKGEGLRESQKKFRSQIIHHTGPNVEWTMADSVDDFEKWANWGRE